MKLRLRSIALALAIAPLANAGNLSSLVKADFTHAEEFRRNGKPMVGFDLSTAGQEKFKQLNKTELNQLVTIRIGDQEHKLRLRAAILGNKLEAGPFSDEEAEKIVAEVNQR